MHPKSILIVDDELLIRDLLYDFFTERNWQVSVADSAEKGLELLKIRRFQIVVVDLKMPEVDGIDFLKKVKTISPAIPTILMTGFPSLESAVEALRLKVDDYVIKPFNINRLYKTIDSIVEENARESAPINIEDVAL
ncbi:MAG: response regulator [Candidatus Zixiibacteriota bacterium]|nr:MAG: response regulator [candidate division Zixibacteria bacterium]